MNPLRSILIYLSKASWARSIVTGWGFSRRAAARFIAGDSLEEAIQVTKMLNQQGLFVTLDHLGEKVNTAEESEVSTEAYFPLLQAIDQSGVQSSISLKLTQLGLGIDLQLCLANLERIVSYAAEVGNFVRIDMEDTPFVDQTLEIFHTLCSKQFNNIGMVIQSYLYRSEADTEDILAAGSSIRLVKGAYQEPASLAYPQKADVDANFDRLARLLVDYANTHDPRSSRENGKCPPIAAIATHDEARIEHAMTYRSQIGLDMPAIEFQMLYGIRPGLQMSIRERGYPVRVYVPYGTEWYPYYVRRLAERPANLWFFLSNLFRSS